MTEGQWLVCTEPMPMLEFLRDSGNPNERKLRLFAAACCRRAWHLLDKDGRAAVEASERLADGLATEAEVKAAIWANLGCQNIDARSAIDYAAGGAWRPAVALLAAVCARSRGPGPSPADPDALARERVAQERIQCDLLRCVFGPLPFRAPRVDPRWRTPPLPSLARAAYEALVAPDASRPGWLILDSARLLVLADALEEVGAEGGLIEHLRWPRPHIRGCWVIDLLTQRE